MSGSLDSDLAIGPLVWLFLTVLGCVTLFFKFSRFWSIRNLDLLLLFAPVPGLILLVGRTGASAVDRLRPAIAGFGAMVGPLPGRSGADPAPPIGAEPELFRALVPDYGDSRAFVDRDRELARRAGSGAKSGRSRLDRRRLGSGPDQARRFGDDGARPETISIATFTNKHPGRSHPGAVGGGDRPDRAGFRPDLGGLEAFRAADRGPFGGGLLFDAPLYARGRGRWRTTVAGGPSSSRRSWRMARPAVAGLAIGLAAGWMPATIGLIPLWAGFYRGRGLPRFASAALGTVALCAANRLEFPSLADLGARPGRPQSGRRRPPPRSRIPLVGEFLDAN